MITARFASLFPFAWLLSSPPLTLGFARGSCRMVTTRSSSKLQGATATRTIRAMDEGSRCEAEAKPRATRAKPRAKKVAKARAKAKGGTGKALATKKTSKKGGMPSRDLEMRYLQSYDVVVGVDEAGRGCLAGPVVAAACVLPVEAPHIEGVKDSKLLSLAMREELYEKITNTEGCIWAACSLDHKRIDEINILAAAMEAFAGAIDQVAQRIPIGKKLYALIDGNRLPENLSVPAEAIVRGDATEYCIAAASIIAKVTRDRYMVEQSVEVSEYGLRENKGYGTAAHMKAIEELGPSPIHRLTFNPVKSWLASRESAGGEEMGDASENE